MNSIAQPAGFAQMLFANCPEIIPKFRAERKKWPKTEKNQKKVLTNGEGSGNLAKLSARETGKGFLKEVGLEKFPKKVLDKRFQVCYDSKAVTPKRKKSNGRCEKEIQKDFKKVLDKDF